MEIEVYCPHCHKCQSEDLDFEQSFSDHEYKCESCGNEFYWLNNQQDETGSFYKNMNEHYKSVKYANEGPGLSLRHHLLGHYKCETCSNPFVIMPYAFLKNTLRKCERCNVFYYFENQFNYLFIPLLIWAIPLILMKSLVPNGSARLIFLSIFTYFILRFVLVKLVVVKKTK